MDYQQLQAALKKHQPAIPMIIIDLVALDANLALLKQQVGDKFDIRIVVKSLPSPGLLDYIMQTTQSRKLMVFHQPFLLKLAQYYGASIDILLGKPMPISAVEHYYTNTESLAQGPRVQWLVDTFERLQQYTQLAQRLALQLSINLEIDTGFHRGGFPNLDAFRQALRWLTDHHQHLRFSGLMGYDPHIPKLPAILKSQARAFAEANAQYSAFKAVLIEEFPNLASQDITFNGAGSPTLSLHAKTTDSPLNEVAIGSGLLKPTDFDISNLSTYQPAVYLATPVLKKLNYTRLPGLEKWAKPIAFFKPSYRHAFFIYGGSWRADYVYPPGIVENPLFGTSTNQVMINLKQSDMLSVDDFVLLRPQQSELVLLQFGPLQTYRNGKLDMRWATL